MNKKKLLMNIVTIIALLIFWLSKIDLGILSETKEEFQKVLVTIENNINTELDTEMTSVSESVSVSDITGEITSVSVSSIPEYDTEAYIYINGNVPFFTEEEKITEAFEIYSPIDDLGRCGVAYANLCTELLPTEKREDISSVYPSGWVQEKYEGIVDQGWLYNRCHLIAYSLAGENANEQNLITGTRYMNIEGMWQFEETVLYYLKENPDNHVLYRVTPLFEADNLVANGVLMEAYSVEDNGAGVCFNVYCYNVSPGIVIDYATGDSWAEE